MRRDVTRNLLKEEAFPLSGLTKTNGKGQKDKSIRHGLNIREKKRGGYRVGGQQGFKCRTTGDMG